MLSFRVILCWNPNTELWEHFNIFTDHKPFLLPNSLDESTERQLEALMLTAKWGKLLIWLIALVTQDKGMPHTSFMLYYVKYFDKNVKKMLSGVRAGTKAATPHAPESSSRWIKNDDRPMVRASSLTTSDLMLLAGWQDMTCGLQELYQLLSTEKTTEENQITQVHPESNKNITAFCPLLLTLHCMWTPKWHSCSFYSQWKYYIQAI